MLFNSLSFAIFFPLVTIGYFLLPQRGRWLWLLLASCYFYMYFLPVYILILFFTIMVDYCAGILIWNSKGKARRKFWLIASIVANTGILAFFKYYNFINDTISQLMGMPASTHTFPVLHILLPVGLSFHTFQAMSYTIEVYRGRQPAERHLGIYALYVMFYPQLVAGPIERPGQLLPQFRTHHAFEYSRVSEGLRRMLWGFFKKMVIADRLSVYVDAVYNDPSHYQGWPVFWATLFFSIQIYCDFSGYCDIALGAARVMGFKLIENFRFPYFSTSFREFWTRWHISLSGWFRDYVYISMGGNRKGTLRWIVNILFVFMLSGLWHGAAWTFVIWGAIHGLLLLAGRYLLPGIRGWTGRLITFALVTFAWIFFRANSWDDALLIVARLFPSGPGIIGIPTISPVTFVINLLLILALVITEWMVFKRDDSEGWLHLPSRRFTRYAVNILLVTCILLFGIFEEQTFIYFQF